jgi:predicted DNA-binding transcriptional regulator AlpA
MNLDLMGPAEIAALFNVSRQRVTQLIAKPDFPPPVADLAMGKVWQTADVRDWGKKNGRL